MVFTWRTFVEILATTNVSLFRFQRSYWKLKRILKILERLHFRLGRGILFVYGSDEQ